MSTNANSDQGLLGEGRLLTTPDGRQIHTMSRGHGADLVVLEAGLGISGLYWGPVYELLAAHTRVVAYERAGYGRSDPDDHPRTLARLAADLETVIDAFPHRRLVLVGHSWGGPIVRMVAALRVMRGQPMTGLVLQWFRHRVLARPLARPPRKYVTWSTDSRVYVTRQPHLENYPFG